MLAERDTGEDMGAIMLSNEQGGIPDAGAASSSHPAHITDATIAAAHAEVAALPREAARLSGPFPLRDGTVLHQRAIRVDDASRLQAFHQRLSERAVFFRFAGILPELNRELAERLSQVDYVDRMAIVLTSGPNIEEPIIAVARYQRVEHDTAEFALVLEDAWQGRGIGPRLLRTLAAYAVSQGFTKFLANVLYDNDRMLALLRHSGMLTTLRIRDGYAEAWLDIARAGRADDAH